MTPSASSITIAGKTVSRLGFGTMRLTRPGTWGDPNNRDTALSVLRQAVHTHGISHIDTAAMVPTRSNTSHEKRPTPTPTTF